MPAAVFTFGGMAQGALKAKPVATPRTWVGRIGAFAVRREVYHVGIWAAATGLLLYLEAPVEDSREVVTVVASVGFYAAIVYFNLNYLFPEYLMRKRVGLYLVLFVLAAAIMTPLRSLVIYWIYVRSPIGVDGLFAQQGLIFLSHLAAGAASTMLKIASDWTRGSRERQRLQQQTLQSELKFLRTQINPHFLFNTLNSLYALTLKKSDRAPETVLKLSAMMRYMLYESNAEAVPLEREVDYLRDYLDLERLRHGRAADIRFDVEGEVDEQAIAPMILVTFVENAFKHGIGKVLGAGFVHMVLLVERDEIRFHIENSKPSDEIGREIGPGEGPGGIGLVNVGRRLDLLYDDRHELHTLVTDDTYAVDLYLDLTPATIPAL